MDQATCRLPGGYIDRDGVVHREVEFAPLSGREEELLAIHTGRESASLVTLVLSRCVQRIGAIRPVSEEMARDILVVDRQYLLLKLREVTFGDRVQANVLCPRPDCGKKVDIDFSTKDVPVREAADSGPICRMELSPEAAFLSDQGEVYRDLLFRLPNGGDQETVLPYLHENEAKALRMLLERCIQSIGPLKNPGGEQIARLSPLACMEIERAMEAVAPKVDLDMEANCPECGRDFIVPFDLQEFFFGEIKTSRDLLYREVHYLAYHYHWSEQEIMGMAREKRRGYIDILADEIERLNNAV